MASAGSYADHLHLSADRWPCQYLTTQIWQTGCPSCCQTNSNKVLTKAKGKYCKIWYKIMHHHTLFHWQIEVSNCSKAEMTPKNKKTPHSVQICVQNFVPDLVHLPRKASNSSSLTSSASLSTSSGCRRRPSAACMLKYLYSQTHMLRIMQIDYSVHVG